MSEAVGEAGGLPPLRLRPFLFKIADEESGGVLGVAKEWRDYVAKSSDADASLITEKWERKMTLKYPTEKVKLTEDAKEAVLSLLHLCKMARVEERNIIHVWYP